VIDAGTRDGETVRLRLTERAGLALTGPGAESAVRAWIAGLVTATGPFGTEVVLTGSVAEQLLAGVPALPSIRAMPRLADALDELEVEVIARARRLVDHADATAYRAAEPADPLPFLLLVAGEVPRDVAGRLWAVLAAGGRLSMGALLLGTSASVAAHVAVDETGHVADVSPELSHLLGARLYQLGAPDARDLLEPVAKAHAESSGEPAPFQAPPPAAEKEPPVAPVLQGPPIIEPRPSPRSDATKAPVQVRLLGPYTIEAWGEPVASGLRGSARELLAWYLLHPQEARAEAANEAIWPDVPLDKGPQRFWTALGNLRSRLRGPSGAPRPELLMKSGDHYEVEADVIEVDVWRFESALAEAVAAGDRKAAMTALSAAVDVYRGDFVEDADYLWAEPVREDFHRRALDACVRLAELQAETGQLDAAVAILERAVQIDAYAEELYRRLMHLHGDRGRPDAVEGTWRRLQGRLAEIDVEPEESTARLHHELTRSPTAPSRTGVSRDGLSA